MAISAGSEAILHSLQGYVTELHEEWKTLIALFGSGDQTVQLLNKTAGALFETVYRTLMRDILLGVARLTDPLQTAGQDNLVLERLTLLPEVCADPSIRASVAAKLVDVKNKAKSFREYRHKYLAHLDLPTSLAPTGDVLPGIKREDVDGVLEEIATLFNMVDGPLRGRHVMFKDVAVHGGTPHLLRALEDAQALKELPLAERARLRKLAEVRYDA